MPGDATGPHDARPHDAWIGLGANLGDAAATLAAATDALDQLPTTHVVRRSSLWRSAPVDAGGPDFTNAVVQLATGLAPLALLDALQAIEQRFLRQRPYRNAPRTLDLDLLLYDALQLDTPRLTLPHPRMHLRAFVLAPMLELDPAIAVPGRGRAQALLQACEAQRLERIPPATSPGEAPR